MKNTTLVWIVVVVVYINDFYICQAAPLELAFAKARATGPRPRAPAKRPRRVGNNKGRNQNSGFKMGTGGARQSVKATKGSTHQIATGRCCDLECEWQRHTEILQRVDREVTAPTFKSVHVCACVYLGTSINYTSTHTDTHRYMHTYLHMHVQAVCLYAHEPAYMYLPFLYRLYMSRYMLAFMNVDKCRHTHLQV